MSEEELKKLKGVVISTAEYCAIQRDAQYILPRLKDAGVYLDHADYAGQFHGFGYFLDNQGEKAELFWQDYLGAIEKHVMQWENCMSYIDDSNFIICNDDEEFEISIICFRV